MGEIDPHAESVDIVDRPIVGDCLCMCTPCATARRERRATQACERCGKLHCNDWPDCPPRDR